ncbi:MAG: hypothetical protein BWZ01_00530 [Deltaproteobacteria bacterium ADurb.BinA179]|nr:MAG: hypothetical protein BWZ01_00530 [Deltaproteobacteria bacterium ADurb.BinA179]
MHVCSRPRRISRSLCLVPLSSPAVGSSRMSTSGSMAITPARATSFFSPCESLWQTLFSKSDIPSIARAFRAAFAASAGNPPRFSGPNATSSSTVGQNS